MQTFFDVCCGLTCRAILNINNFRRGYWVSGLIFVSWKYNIYRQIFFILFIYLFIFFEEEIFFDSFLHGKRSVDILFFVFYRRGNERKRVNQKPNISSCLTSSEAVMNYVWYQAIRQMAFFEKCLIFQIFCFYYYQIYYIFEM